MLDRSEQAWAECPPKWCQTLTVGSKASFSLNFPLQSIGAVVSSQNFCVGVSIQRVSSHLWTTTFRQSVLKSCRPACEIWWRSDNVDGSYPRFLCFGECCTFDARTAHRFNILRLSEFTWSWSVFQERLMEMEIMQKKWVISCFQKGPFHLLMTIFI